MAQSIDINEKAPIFQLAALASEPYRGSSLQSGHVSGSYPTQYTHSVIKELLDRKWPRGIVVHTVQGQHPNGTRTHRSFTRVELSRYREAETPPWILPAGYWPTRNTGDEGKTKRKWRLMDGTTGSHR